MQTIAKRESSAHAEALGKRLKDARLKSGITQETAAEAIALPRSAISNIEAGTRTVSTFELTTLAHLYKVTRESLYPEHEQQVDKFREELRLALPELDSDPTAYSAVWPLIDICREGTKLRALLNRPARPLSWGIAVGPPSPNQAIRHGEHVAAAERNRLGLGPYPSRLGYYPVINPAELIRAHDVWLSTARLPQGVSGLYLKEENVGSAIFVNESLSGFELQFALMHELAHVFLEVGLARATRSENASTFSEVRANAFATAMLMPSEDVVNQLDRLNKGRPTRMVQKIFDSANREFSEVELRTDAGSQTIVFSDVLLLAGHFNVSYDAVVWRLRNLARITESEARRLLQSGSGNPILQQLHEIKALSAPATPTLRDLRVEVVWLAFEALWRKRISLENFTLLLSRMEEDVEGWHAVAESVRQEDAEMMR